MTEAASIQLLQLHDGFAFFVYHMASSWESGDVQSSDALQDVLKQYAMCNRWDVPDTHSSSKRQANAGLLRAHTESVGFEGHMPGHDCFSRATFWVERNYTMVRLPQSC